MSRAGTDLKWPLSKGNLSTTMRAFSTTDRDSWWTSRRRTKKAKNLGTVLNPLRKTRWTTITIWPRVSTLEGLEWEITNRSRLSPISKNWRLWKINWCRNFRKRTRMKEIWFNSFIKLMHRVQSSQWTQMKKLKTSFLSEKICWLWKNYKMNNDWKYYRILII